MKRYVALILALLLVLTGCGAEKSDSEQKLPDEKKESVTEKKPEEKPQVNMTPAEQALRYEAEIVAYEGEETSADKEPLLTYGFHVPVLSVRREDGTQVTEAGNQKEKEALAKAQTFNTTFEQWTAEADIDGTIATAKEHLKLVKEIEGMWTGGYALDLACDVYQTERMVSVSGLYYTYTGGAHPNTYHMGWNFDLETGTFLDVKMLGEDDGLQKAVAEEILRCAGQPQDGWVPIEGYWEDHETIIADWSSYAVSFNEEGMTVIFSPYELAPYAAGAQEFHFTYEFLEPYLSAEGKLLLGLEGKN